MNAWWPRSAVARMAYEYVCGASQGSSLHADAQQCSSIPDAPAPYPTPGSPTNDSASPPGGRDRQRGTHALAERCGGRSVYTAARALLPHFCGAVG